MDDRVHKLREEQEEYFATYLASYLYTCPKRDYSRDYFSDHRPGAALEGVPQDLEEMQLLLSGARNRLYHAAYSVAKRLDAPHAERTG